MIVKAYHKDFDPGTGEWDINSDVRANLSIREDSPITWGYKDYDGNRDDSYSAHLDASRSFSAKPKATYTYDMGLNGDYQGIDRTSNSNTLTLSDYASPSDILGTPRPSGSIPLA